MKKKADGEVGKTEREKEEEEEEEDEEEEEQVGEPLSQVFHNTV